MSLSPEPGVLSFILIFTAYTAKDTLRSEPEEKDCVLSTYHKRDRQTDRLILTVLELLTPEGYTQEDVES